MYEQVQVGKESINKNKIQFLYSGIRPIDFLGNFYMTNATEMIFGTIDSDKSVSVELKHDDKLPVESNTYIQVRFAHFFIFNYRCSNRLRYFIQV